MATRTTPVSKVCVLCGTCTCAPCDEDLINYQGSHQDRDFVHEDDVIWLNKARLIIGCVAPPQSYHFATTQESYLTGIVRRRFAPSLGQSRYEFTRGSATDINFGQDVRTIKGEGVSEVISVPYVNLSNDSQTRQRIIREIHERCLHILARVLLYQEQKGLVFDERNLMVGIEPEIVDRLIKRDVGIQPIWCFSKQAWRTPDIDDMYVGDYPKMPKVYFSDPLGEVHITRLKPLLTKYRYANSVDKFNNHLDYWQRALVLVKKSYHGDPLSDIPAEIMMHVASYLSARQTAMLCYASHAVAWKLNQAGLWFNRLRDDMPWLWDVSIERILEEQAQYFKSETREAIDWQAIYFDLREQSIFESRKRTLGLVNRRRIWHICQQLLG